MSFPRYPKYKDSGVEWLGEVPEGWELQRSDVHLRTSRDLLDSSEMAHAEVFHYSIPIVQTTGDGQIEDGSEIDSSKIVIRQNAILISKLNPRKGTVCKSTPKDLLTVCSSEFVPLISYSIDYSFLYYLVTSEAYRMRLESLVESATRSHQRVTPTDIMKFWWAWPVRSEQQTIASFLDRETAKIDALVAEQENLIALLKEKRQAVISHAVTKGLDPTVPMKDSGIEWLGEVPAHWEFGPLKRFWSVTDCKHLTAEFVEDGIPLASIREVQSRWVSLDNAKCTTEYFYELLTEGGRCPVPGDLIFSRNATVGEVAQVNESHPRFAMGQDVVLLRKLSPSFSSDYFQQTLRSISTAQQLTVMMIGSTFKRINVEEIRSIVVPSPPIEEQSAISKYVDTETAKLDTLTAEAQRAIDLLKERRSALISAAVTGKIDVRHAV